MNARFPEELPFLTHAASALAGGAPPRARDDGCELYVSLLENSTDFIAIIGLSGEILYINEAGRRLFDLESLENARATPALALLTTDEARRINEIITPELQRSGRWCGELQLRTLRAGESIPVSSKVFQIRDPISGDLIAVASVSSDLRARRRIENRMQVLVEAGAALSASLDPAATLQNVARLVVQSFATTCFVDVITERDIIERIAIAHRDPSRQEHSKNVRRLLSVEEDPKHPIARAIGAGASTIVPVIDEAWILASTNSEERAQHLRSLQMRSLIVVPIRGPDQRIIGAITCGISIGYDAPSFDDDDLRFAEELARRAGVAIDNARRYERERRIAVSLQEASLPQTMPRTKTLLLDAEYRPGKTEATIGGDWYDAFVLRDGRIALTLGDVLGNGLRAAVTMTKLRQAMQSAAMVRADPNLMLDIADETLRLHDPDGYATAIAAIYDPSSHALHFASAGHPGPKLRTPDGHIEELTSQGMMLGLRSGNDRDVELVATPPGSMLVFYTDGLTEATRDIDEGHRRLSQALSSPEITNAAHPARALVERILDNEPATDDIAVLIANITFVDQASSELFSLAPERKKAVTTRWSFDSGDAPAAHAARCSFTAHLRADRDDGSGIDTYPAEIVLGELIGNVQRHAPGPIVIEADWGTQSVAISVTDTGLGFEQAAVLPGDPLSDSGRGLFLVATHAIDFRVTYVPGGGCIVRTVVPVGSSRPALTRPKMRA